MDFVGTEGILPRAGRFVRQPAGYSAFIPAKLPPEPGIQFDEKLIRLLSEADRALARLDGSLSTLPNPKYFVFMYVRREAVLSSQIEGTQSSLQDLLSDELSLPDVPSDVVEVSNYVSAITYGIERLQTLPVSTRLLRELHEKLLQGTRGQTSKLGEFRTSQNWIGSAGGGLRDAIYVPPPPQEVGDAMSDLEKFVHEPDNLPELIWIALVHAQFETIHPFVDGNGRVGRLLIVLLLRERGLISRPLLYLSHHFKRYRQQYYELLQAIRTDGAWEEWLIFFLEGIATVSREALDTGKKILALRNQHLQLVNNLGRIAGNATLALEKLFNQPLLRIKNLQEHLDVTYPVAKNLVDRLVACDILQEITGHSRNRVFAYRSYLDLLSDN